MPQPLLQTARLDLVPLADDHLELEVELDSDPEVLRFLWGRPRTREEVERNHHQRLARAGIVDGLGMWVGFLRSVEGPARQRFVGLWMLTPPHGPSQEPVVGEADLGYRVLRRHWRQGYASEGSRELLRHGFEVVGLTRVFAQTMAVNAGSRATMTSIGMQFARGFHEQHDEPVPGSEQGEVEYELRREDWAPRGTAG
ncbi:GNAT family N-acetyltransferase [Pedococcus sp. KACC 23699]|uniref:GNAT family N-acetyltransferase n=1 Tax=Pedococcus sp. KACC 23699 TaxID=3149228 RepID=A0AAU7JYT2_9MICO